MVLLVPTAEPLVRSVARCHTLVLMPKSLWNEFAADRLDHRALQNIVQRHFPSGSQPGVREVVYPGDGEHAIKLRFSKNDTLVGIEAGPGLGAAFEATLTTALADALVETGPLVFRSVRFADYKLTGSWRYKDQFQISPVPAQAPQLNCLIGDHPFLLEVKIIGSKDGFVTSQRAADATRTAELLLAGLVNNSIHPLTTRSMYGYWVHPPGDDYRATAYLQPHYRCDIPESDDFSPETQLAPVAPAHELFGPYGMTAGTPLCIPDGLTEALDTYHGLAEDVQEQFLRSCYWLRQANRLFLESFSAAFMAVVTAAEALFHTTPAGTCATCGQAQHRSRTAFAQLLETYVPLEATTSRGYGGKPSFQARLKHLYDTRSQITHGSDLRGWDTAHGFTPLQSQDDNDLRTLLRIMPLALTNWLQEQTKEHTRARANGVLWRHQDSV